MLNKTSTFIIKKNSTLPVLKYPLTEILMEKYDITEDMLENVAVTFSLYDVGNDVFKIANKAARLDINTDFINNPDDDKYTLSYKFTVNETSKYGHFQGEFKVDFLGDYCGKITFPVNGKINIIVKDSITKTTVLTQTPELIDVFTTFDDTFDDSFF